MEIECKYYRTLGVYYKQRFREPFQNLTIIVFKYLYVPEYIKIYFRHIRFGDKSVVSRLRYNFLTRVNKRYK